MTKDEFFHALTVYGFDTENVLIDDPTMDGYGIRKVYWRWEIFYRERGVEYFTRGYPSESDALTALLDDILRDTGRDTGKDTG